MAHTITPDGLYHADLGLPWPLVAGIQAAQPLEYGPHARQAAITDRFATLTQAPLTRAFNATEVFEVEVEQGEVVKIAVRISSGFTANSYSGKPVDLVLVLTPSRRTRGWFVKTLWFNHREDRHYTLDRSKYQTL